MVTILFFSTSLLIYESTPSTAGNAAREDQPSNSVKSDDTSTHLPPLALLEAARAELRRDALQGPFGPGHFVAPEAYAPAVQAYEVCLVASSQEDLEKTVRSKVFEEYGWLLYKTKDITLGRKLVKQAVETDPKNLKAQLKFAIILHTERQSADSVEGNKDLVAIDSQLNMVISNYAEEVPDAHYMKAIVQAQLKNHGEMVKHYKIMVDGRLHADNMLWLWDKDRMNDLYNGVNHYLTSVK